MTNFNPEGWTLQREPGPVLANESARRGEAAGPPAEEMALRRLLWLRHGCAGLYGDDGEMQCGRCGLDFKRNSAEAIEAVWVRKAWAALAAPPDGATP